ncbi:biopolymer transporter ExbD [candidate division KSB1 bacterium]|nr:biopolymer transporter ExbD [candidate division KSB1 bacterium]
MKFNTTRKRLTMFTVISLTDIVLLLLIYFLLASSFVVQPGIKVTLPRAVSGQQEDADRINLTVTKDEQLFLNGRLVAASDLLNQLRPLIRQRPDKTIIIRADRDLTLQATIRVIDTAKLAGAEKFMIATEPSL